MDRWTLIAEDYWNDNWKRWRKVLHIAAEYCDMYELERPQDHYLDKGDPARAAYLFFWNTTHKKGTTKFHRQDEVFDTDPEFDAPTCFACIVGECFLLGLSRIDIPYILKTSNGRIHGGKLLWDQFSDDYKKMIRGLRGDMKNEALRSLVLGHYWRDHV